MQDLSCDVDVLFCYMCLCKVWQWYSFWFLVMDCNILRNMIFNKLQFGNYLGKYIDLFLKFIWQLMFLIMVSELVLDVFEYGLVVGIFVGEKGRLGNWSGGCQVSFFCRVVCMKQYGIII